MGKYGNGGMMIDLRRRAKELAKEAADYSRQGIALIKNGDIENGHTLMKKANETGKRCRVILQQLVALSDSTITN